jgi:hypothetical protein
MAETRQRQVNWVKAIYASLYIDTISAEVREQQQIVRKVSAVMQEALRIKKCFLSWFHRHIFRKYCLAFRKKAGLATVLFRINLRIKQKRKAIHLMATFFKHYHIIMNSYNKVIRCFTRSTRLVQKNVRSFRLCRAAKVEAISIMWRRLEYKYIQITLRKEEQRKILMRRKEIDLESLNPKEKQEMKVCDLKWNSVDMKMTEKVRILKRFKVIKSETEEETIDRLQISETTMHSALIDMILMLRKNFFYEQMYSKKKQPLTSDQCFSNDEARDMLLGRNVDSFQTMIASKFEKKLPMVVFAPFYLFTTITPAMVNKLVLQAHKKERTFELEFSKDSTYAPAAEND